MSKIGEACDALGQFYVSGTGDASNDEIRISFVEGNVQAWRDFPLVELMQLRSMINDGIEELFRLNQDIKCPDCGYTQYDADFHGDHRVCRRFPFFPGETGKSEAVEPGCPKGSRT